MDMQSLSNLTRFTADGIALKIGVSIGIGMLVGFEREWSNKDVGIRTFGLVSLAGMLSVLVSEPFALAWLFGVIVIVALMNIRSLRADNSLEVTTSASLLVVYTLGVLVGHGHMFTPVASCIFVTMLLAWKTELHRFAGGVTPQEIRSAIVLGLIGFVIYPILPNEFVDPWLLVNPRSAWIIVIVVAGIGFVNYVLLRLYSNRGLYWSAALGGMVNSTAAIAELANVLRPSETLLGMLIPLDLLTVVAMFSRNLLLLLVFARSALGIAILPMLAMGCMATLLIRQNTKKLNAEPTDAVKLSSPLILRKVLQFAALFLAIEVAGTLGTRQFGRAGMIAVSIFGGLVSSASTTAAAASMALHNKITPEVAGMSTVLTSMTSAIVNVPLIWRQTRRMDLVWRLMTSTFIILVPGLIALLGLIYLHS